MSKMFHHADKLEISDESSELKCIQQVESKNSSQEFGCYEHDELGSIVSQHQIYQEGRQLYDFAKFDDLYLDVGSPPFQSCEDEIKRITGAYSEQSHVSPSASFHVLSKYTSRRLKSNVVQETQTLSTETIIKLAAENFIQSTSLSKNEIATLNHPYPSSILAHSEEDLKEIQLVQNLLSCAEKSADKQYERAIKFLKTCKKTSSCTGTPIQRLVYYFSEALSEKIAKETGRIAPKELGRNVEDPLEPVKSPNKIMIAFQREHPISQITKLVGIQAILDHVNEVKNVHVIDLEIRSGVQWIILMQALASKSDQNRDHRLKITAIETKLSKSRVEDICRQLSSFAESLNLNFTFKIVPIENILDLKRDQFELDPDEFIAVYSAYSLMSMIGEIDRLDHLMIVIKSIKPSVMIVIELEANCNSSKFVERFVESLFFFSACFDSLADCFKNDEISRRGAESMWFRLSIRNVLVAEGDERKIRHVNINVWRAFFARFGLMEIELSILALDQANIAVSSFSCGGSCTLFRDGKCLTIGWKGTPLTSISVWKFL